MELKANFHWCFPINYWEFWINESLTLSVGLLAHRSCVMSCQCFIDSNLFPAFNTLVIILSSHNTLEDVIVISVSHVPVERNRPKDATYPSQTCRNTCPSIHDRWSVDQVTRKEYYYNGKCCQYCFLFVSTWYQLCLIVYTNTRIFLSSYFPEPLSGWSGTICLPDGAEEYCAVFISCSVEWIHIVIS